MPTEARAYPRPLPNSEWLGRLTEEILEPDLPIVDPHHHLWDHPGSRYLLDHRTSDPEEMGRPAKASSSGYRREGRSALPSWDLAAATRGAKLSKRQRAEIAKRAAEARWKAKEPVG
jgi:hypothetical protein